jgi:lipid-A-disaccharide synthase
LKLYIIAGEASGDLHGSNLIKALKKKKEDVSIRAWGGDKMQEQGAELVQHYKDLAFMGFIEVAKNLPTILKNISYCKEDIEAYNPDALILIDYPGFNLRIAGWAKEKGLKVIYYISPQIWAWNTGRVKKIKKLVDEMICILPFEKDFYAEHGMQVSYVGHPLLEAVNDSKSQAKGTKNQATLLLLPGSRKQEIKRMLPIMLSAAQKLDKYKVVLAGLSAIGKEYYQSLVKTNSVELRIDETYACMRQSDIAWVSSGTATLEAALFNLPQVVCYSGNKVSYLIARKLVKVKYISLVNLIADKPLITELIQDELTISRLLSETKNLETQKQEILAAYESDVISQLGDGTSSKQAASIILTSLLS